MIFRDNVFDLVNLKGTILNGSLSGTNSLFYLADLKPDNMEYRLNIAATNIDPSFLDDLSDQKKDTNAELSFNASLSGRGLNFSKRVTTTGYINIYKIGENFANKLMKGLSDKKGRSMLGRTQVVVDNFNIPTGFYFNIDSGLVYATVTLKKKILGYIVSIEENKVQYDRIPIQEFIRKVGDENEEN